MNQGTDRTLTVAGHVRSVEDALGVLEKYPRKTPAAFDYLGAGDLRKLTAQEVIRTRKISSRISNKEVTYFLEASETAPWIRTAADLANADPDRKLFAAMTDLYWHFAEGSPKGVSFAKISKVLHLKQPSLFPILDSHVARAYAPAAKILRKDHRSLDGGAAPGLPCGRTYSLQEPRAHWTNCAAESAPTHRLTRRNSRRFG